MIIYYYISQNGDNPVREFLLSLEIRQQAKIRRILATITEYGLQPVIPHLRKLTGTPLWEIRILGQDNIRILYVTAHREAILALHGFIKKSQKTPEREINTALERYKEWGGR